MIKQVWKLHRSSWRFALACPLLFAVPVVAELVQHAAELHTGMFDSFAQAEAVASHPLRTATGMMKTLAMTLPAYWFVRYLGHGESAAAARSWDAQSLRLSGFVALWVLAWTLPFMFAGDALRGAGVGEKAILIMGLGLFLTSIVVETFLAPWKAAAPLGNAAIGFGRSIGLVRGHLLWALGVFVLAFLPLMVVHYALGLGAIGLPTPIVVAMLVVDAVVVGLLANVLIGINFVIARRVTEAAGVRLVPDAEAKGEIGARVVPAAAV